MKPPPVSGAGPAGPREARAELRALARELEGVFLAQLFQAMRASVPEGGLTEGAPGREMFTALLDEGVAKQAAARMQRGLGEALYRQLSRRFLDVDPGHQP